MKLNDLSESRKMLKLLKENRQEQQPRPPRSYSEFSKSPRDKKTSFEKSTNITQQIQQSSNLSDSTSLYVWGLSGQFVNNFKPRQSQDQYGIVAQSQGIQSCAAGEGHMFYITNKNEIYGYGSSQYGQLGIENVQNLMKPTLIQSLKEFRIAQITCGAEHTFMITNKGEVFSWGLNIKGQLGLGSYENMNVPTLVYSLLPFGQSNGKAGHKRQKSVNETGGDTSPALKDRSSSIDNIMEQIIMMKEKFKGRNTQRKTEEQLQLLLANDEVVISISCGALHTIILTSKNRLFSCGFGQAHALGHDDTTTLSEFKMIQNFNKLNQKQHQNDKIDKICCGLAHSACIIDGKPYLWGMMGQRESLIFRQPTQISDDELDNIIDIKAGECFTIMLSYRGEVYTIGENTECQLGLEITYADCPILVQGLPLISQIACGRNHCLALSTDFRSIYGWGSNQYGQLTGNSKGSVPIIIPRMLFQLPADGLKISCGSFYTLLIASANFELPLEDSDEDQMNQTRISTQNLNKELKDEIEKLQEELEKSKQEQDTLKIFNIQLLQKTEKMKSELIISSKKKLGNDYKKTIDQKTQTNESYLHENKKGGTQNIKKQNSKFDITALEVSPERPIKHRIFQTSLDIDYNELHLEKQISEGGYGIIYRAKWRETTVAVKMFKIEGMNENHIRDFLSECHAMEALRHPNIVMFLGACTKPPNLAIVLEYCTRGSLWSVLQNHDIHLTWEDRRKIALDAAKGVWYLHCFNPPILHRDLKSLNLLLDDGLRTKLADFGWTRTMANYMTSKIGTYQWMAPEVIGGQTYTEKADVFSFGIILWEIASREPPYRNISGLQVSYEVLNNDFRPTIPKKTPEVFSRLTKRCWDRDPEKRPSFKEIIKDLESMKFPSGI